MYIGSHASRITFLVMKVIAHRYSIAGYAWFIVRSFSDRVGRECWTALPPQNLEMPHYHPRSFIQFMLDKDPTPGSPSWWRTANS